MATFKAIVRTSYKRVDGTYRVYIRVTHNRQQRYLPTPFYLTQDQFTKSGRIKDASVLDNCEEKIREMRENAKRLGFVGDGLPIEHFVQLLGDQASEIDFISFFRRYVEKIRKDGRDGTADLYECALNSLHNFNKKKPLFFSHITRQYMLNYFESLHDLKPNTQLNYIYKIRAVYSAAQRQYNNPEVGLTVVRYGVFDLIKLPERTSAKDNAIKTVEQMQALINEPYTGLWTCDLAKDMFILSFVCFGTNIADWITMTQDQYKDGILYYRRKKIGRQAREKADMEIRVPEVGKIILEKYSGDPKYIINFGRQVRNNRFVRYIHYFFAKIGLEEMPEGIKMHDIGSSKNSRYTFYANRHSMASFAINVCGIDYMIVHEMLNHAMPSRFRTTDAYIWRDYKHLWEANEKLVALFDWSFYTEQHHEPSKQYYNVTSRKQ